MSASRKGYDLTTLSAIILIPTVLIAIFLGSSVKNDYLSKYHLISLVTDYLIGFFFLNIGLELRWELTSGVLLDRKLLSISMFSALSGMVTPAAIFLAATYIAGISHKGWGITMATDLPLVLVLLSTFRKKSVRGFVLALATFDDIGSVIVLSLLYHQKISYPNLIYFLLFLGLYLLLVRYQPNFLVGIALFVAALYFGHRAGFQASLIGVLFGVLAGSTKGNQEQVGSLLRKTMEPFSAFVVVPLFIFISLDRNFHFHLRLLTSGLLVSLVLARLIGKPLGIFFGTLIAKRILRVDLPFNLRDLLLVGTLATLGLSVSMLFAVKDFSGPNQSLAILAILFTIPLGILLSSFAKVATGKSAT